MNIGAIVRVTDAISSCTGGCPHCGKPAHSSTPIGTTGRLKAILDDQDHKINCRGCGAYPTRSQFLGMEHKYVVSHEDGWDHVYRLEEISEIDFSALPGETETVEAVTAAPGAEPEHVPQLPSGPRSLVFGGPCRVPARDAPEDGA
ncbi:MAG: hypothetical protein ACOC5M_02280 [Chloroflexota bacterium]